MRLRAINTRGCVLQTAFLGLSNRLRPRRCVPIRSHRRDITRAREFRVPPRLHVHYTRDAFTGVSRESDANGTTAVVAEGNRPVRPSPTSSPFFLSFFLFFCRNESTVGIPLSLSFRWSVRSLILACTPRASQGHSWEGGRNVQTETKKRRQTSKTRKHRGTAPVRDDSRFRFQELASTKCKPIAV